MLLTIDFRRVFLIISLLSTFLPFTKVFCEDLEVYSQKCDNIIGVSVPDFNCNDGALIPTTNHLNNNCDRPNRLDEECDPDSRYLTLYSDSDVDIVAVCRRKKENNRINDMYGDIAVIQTRKTGTNAGATCFYQALEGSKSLSGDVKAPINGQNEFWFSPPRTASIACASCHDNGAIIRSPYLDNIQLPTQPHQLPGSGVKEYNEVNTPYGFVGEDFAHWITYEVTVQGNSCTTCHRMGTNNLSTIRGASLSFGLKATDNQETHKNPHSTNSPIWMKPGQITYNQSSYDDALDIANCAQRKNENPLPQESGCTITQFSNNSFENSTPPPEVSTYDQAETIMQLYAEETNGNPSDSQYFSALAFINNGGSYEDLRKKIKRAYRSKVFDLIFD